MTNNLITTITGDLGSRKSTASNTLADAYTHVLFINPISPNGIDYGFTTPPIGLSSLAGTVAEAGYKIDCFDMQLPGRTEKALLKELQAKRPDVVCVTMTSMLANYSAQLLSAMRTVLPDAWYIAGGVHATVRPKDTLRAGFDVVVMGEGELVLLELLKRSGDRDVGDINGVATIDSKGVPRVGMRADRIKDLDGLALPELEKFGFPGGYNQFSMTSSRGCLYACNYCGSKTIFGRSVSFQSVERVMKEVSRAICSYGQKEAIFVDDTFNVDQRRFDRILDEFISLRQETGVDFKWSMNSRIDTGTRTDWKKAAHAGCCKVEFGIETGSEKILRNIDKNIRLADVVPVVKAASEAGLEIRASWIVGLPGDYEEQLKSIPLMTEVAPYVTNYSVHNILPLPGTPYGDAPERYGIHYDEQALLKTISFNALPPPEVLSLDYLSREQMIDVFERMESTLRPFGFTSPANSKPGDKLIRTPINRGSRPIESLLEKVKPTREDLPKTGSAQCAIKGP